MSQQPVDDAPPEQRHRVVNLGRRVTVLSAIIAFSVSSAMIFTATHAAFNATTTNPGNSWTVASVTLGDDDSAQTLFNPTGLANGATGTKCIKVTFTGNVASEVNLYATPASYTGSLGGFIDLTVEEGTNGNGDFAACGTFAGTTIYTGTLSGFAATTWASNLGTWTPNTNGDYKVYRFVYTFRHNPAIAGLSSNIGFTWEARNS